MTTFDDLTRSLCFYLAEKFDSGKYSVDKFSLAYYGKNRYTLSISKADNKDKPNTVCFQALEIDSKIQWVCNNLFFEDSESLVLYLLQDYLIVAY